MICFWHKWKVVEDVSTPYEEFKQCQRCGSVRWTCLAGSAAGVTDCFRRRKGERVLDQLREKVRKKWLEGMKP